MWGLTNLYALTQGESVCIANCLYIYKFNMSEFNQNTQIGYSDKTVAFHCQCALKVYITNLLTDGQKEAKNQKVRNTEI